MKEQFERMVDLRKKAQREDLSGLEALEYLRQLRGTSTQSLPETKDPQVRLAFGRGYKVVGPTATLDELLATPCPPSETASDYRDRSSWPEDEDYVFRQPLDPTVGLYQGKLVDTFVVVRRATVEEGPKLSPEIDEQFLGQISVESGVENTPLMEAQMSPKSIRAVSEANLVSRTVESEIATSEPILAPVQAMPAKQPKPPKQPVGRPKSAIRLTDAERKAAYRLKLRQAEEPAEAEPGTSVLDSFPRIVKSRGKTTDVSPNLLVKKILEQNERCIYCQRRFGSAVLIDGRVRVLKAQIEHFQPKAERQNNNPANIYAACQICNHRIKSSRMFESVEEARSVIQAVWKERNWQDAPDPIACPTCGGFEYRATVQRTPVHNSSAPVC
jgi:hypothetical protein